MAKTQSYRTDLGWCQIEDPARQHADDLPALMQVLAEWVPALV